MSDDNKLGGRGQCHYCGKMVNNVSYHEANACKKRPQIAFAPTELGEDLYAFMQEVDHYNRLVLATSKGRVKQHIGRMQISFQKKHGQDPFQLMEKTFG